MVERFHSFERRPKPHLHLQLDSRQEIGQDRESVHKIGNLPDSKNKNTSETQTSRHADSDQRPDGIYRQETNNEICETVEDGGGDEAGGILVAAINDKLHVAVMNATNKKSLGEIP